MKTKGGAPPAKPKINALVLGYKKLIVLLSFFTVSASLLGLLIPKIIARAIDSYAQAHTIKEQLLWQFAIVTFLVFVFTYLQSVVQSYASEVVARDLRQKLAEKIAQQNYSYVMDVSPARLLTNLTSDADAVKLYVGMAIGNLISSYCLLFGASILLLLTNWKLALVVLALISIIWVARSIIMKKIRKFFREVQGIIDWLNKVINESILGASLIRVLNTQHQENNKFIEANTKARNIRLTIIRYLAILIPVITFVASLSSMVILLLGGHFVITDSMSLGDFSAFYSYIGIMIFPIIMIGFMANIIAQSSASYERIVALLSAEGPKNTGTQAVQLTGPVQLNDITLRFGEKKVLNEIALAIQPGTKTAIIGPTAAGKTQLLYVMSGLVQPLQGKVLYNGVPLEEIDKQLFHRQMGFVFQDSVIFNMTIRENIAFAEDITSEDMQKAIRASELTEFIETLPDKLETVISERGLNLSGGQKQRIMLARALALNPKVLLLDDFTARVDAQTEKRILENVSGLYPGITLISVTQKISSVTGYDQCVLLMEGEIIATGTHAQLLQRSPEYNQLFESQKSTSQYELPA
ncbi:ABC transporter ATP-binding protein [Niastella koreensis]|uniref:Xenobiotic-transporting ATPase n=2 Tax=Niastella koreensis TaxID=354356 RepID=G8TLV5_NIAKG|nr:ABC transporter ATP-binding protein [Niastella koreensis]AEV97697.1 Xenobiotic-transporting ATPase [Niastella koreensis GR20-10]OQP40482.1 ABC transporter ATP-binding protein [Niastella koreensis]